MTHLTDHQNQISLCARNPHHTPPRRHPIRPLNALLRLVFRLPSQPPVLNPNATPQKRIPKHIRQIVPDLLSHEIVRKHRLRRRGIQPIRHARDLQRDPAARGVSSVDFGVGGVGGHGGLRADG